MRKMKIRQMGDTHGDILTVYESRNERILFYHPFAALTREHREEKLPRSSVFSSERSERVVNQFFNFLGSSRPSFSRMFCGNDPLRLGLFSESFYPTTSLRMDVRCNCILFWEIARISPLAHFFKGFFSMRFLRFYEGFLGDCNLALWLDDTRRRRWCGVCLRAEDDSRSSVAHLFCHGLGDLSWELTFSSIHKSSWV
jgi:hypothetical protein